MAFFFSSVRAFVNEPDLCMSIPRSLDNSMTRLLLTSGYMPLV